MDTSGYNSERSYSQEDIQQILHLAIARQADDQDKEFSYEQLVEIAGELDISLDSLKLAETDWLTQRGEIQQRQAFNIYRQGRFKKRFGNFAIINGFLLVLDFIGGGTVSWSLYILVIWGLTVVLDGWNTYQTKGDDYELAFQRWNRKHQIKQSFNSLMNKFLKFTSG
jgi:2TM domain